MDSFLYDRDLRHERVNLFHTDIEEYWKSLKCRGPFRSTRLQMFFKIDVLKNFEIFTEKHLCWGVFLIKLQACNSNAGFLL